MIMNTSEWSDAARGLFIFTIVFIVPMLLVAWLVLAKRKDDNDGN